MVLTFYSYKGGVGRTMALANIAELFYQAGKRVLMIDWDLEAPGLEKYFPVDQEKLIEKPGVMDLLMGYKEQVTRKLPEMEDGSMPFQKPEELFVDIYGDYNEINKGRLWLLGAGKRSKEHFLNYVNNVLSFDWGDFYDNWEGELYFEWLRQQFEEKAEITLIDSRTGFTEMTGVCTYQLADTILMFCATNQQNIYGTYKMLQKFTATELQDFRPGRRPLDVLIIPARVEDRAEIKHLNEFARQFKNTFDKYLSNLHIPSLHSFLDLKIPYVPYYSFNEMVAVREPSEFSHDIEQAFKEIYNKINILNEKGAKSVNNHIIIGLGGTGGKIIRSLRKKIFQKFRKNELDDINIDYLYVDSNQEHMKSDDPTWKILENSVQLNKKKQQLCLGNSDFESVLGNINKYPGIEPWINNPNQLKGFLISLFPAINAQKRRIGRFLFANKIREFRSSLKNFVSKHKNSENSHSEITTFHICCSLSGGTGSGSLIDAICQIRSIYPDDEKFQIVVYAILPEVVSAINTEETPDKDWDDSLFHANGYAALTEINALNLNRWMLHDISEDNEMIELNDSFNGCYLIENKNENGDTPDIDKELPDIIADFIYNKTVTIKNAIDTLLTLKKIENSNTLPETTLYENNNTPERSRKFLTFGIKSVGVAIPKDKILKYLTNIFTEQACLRFLFENWQDDNGFVEETKAQNFNELVLEKKILENWKLTDKHICLSICISEADLTDKKWITIEEDWGKKINKQTIQKTVADKRKRTEELKEICIEHYSKTYRGSGVEEFYKSKTNEKDKIVYEICRNIEKSLFEKYRTGDYSIVDIESILSSVILYLNERLIQIDNTMQKLIKTRKEKTEKIAEKDREWSGVISDFFLNKFDLLLDDQVDLHKELYISRTWIEGWKFAKLLLPELIIKLKTLKKEVETCADIMRQTFKKVEMQLEENSENFEKKDSEMLKHFVHFYQPEKVKGLCKKLRINYDMQKKQTDRVKEALIERSGIEISFKVFNNNMTLQNLLKTMEAECLKNVKKVYDKHFDDTYNGNILDELYDCFSNDQDSLKEYLFNLVKCTGNYLSMSNKEKQRKGPGIPDTDTCISKFIAIIPYSQKHHNFIQDIENILQMSQHGIEIVHADEMHNEITLINITNIFPLRFIEILGLLKKQYETKIALDSDRAISELHIDDSGSSHPSLLC